MADAVVEASNVLVEVVRPSVLAVVAIVEPLTVVLLVWEVDAIISDTVVDAAEDEDCGAEAFFSLVV